MIEAIPNVSEGRDGAVIAALEDAVRSIRGIIFLGSAPDRDHNRTVISFAAPDGDTIRDATLALLDVAFEKIDLRRHEGEHPRIGAVDVIPFVPLGATEMATCISLANELGQMVAARFDLPVFLYEYAARDDFRRALPEIRTGGLEKLAKKMKTPEWAPDFGPSDPHPSAGVSVIGARRPLIAFNVQLSSDDIAVASEIARAVRESDGGLPAVRALPIRLAERGLVQVSMNLVDYERTSLATLFDTVCREAKKRGTEVLSSELIGLAPAAALLEVAADALSLENFSPDLVLENKIGWNEGPR